MRARNKPISSAPDRAKCQQTGISALDLAGGLRAARGEATTVPWASRLLARSSREGRRLRRVPHAGRESPWGLSRPGPGFYTFCVAATSTSPPRAGRKLEQTVLSWIHQCIDASRGDKLGCGRASTCRVGSKHFLHHRHGCRPVGVHGSVRRRSIQGCLGYFVFLRGSRRKMIRSFGEDRSSGAVASLPELVVAGTCSECPGHTCRRTIFQ